jgi:signal transduction histidine kinase
MYYIKLLKKFLFNSYDENSLLLQKRKIYLYLYSSVIFLYLLNNVIENITNIFTILYVITFFLLLLPTTFSFLKNDYKKMLLYITFFIQLSLIYNFYIFFLYETVTCFNYFFTIYLSILLMGVFALKTYQVHILSITGIFYTILPFLLKINKCNDLKILFSIILIIILEYVIYFSFLSIENKNERLKKTKEDLEKANNKKNDFIAKMSHEFKTPLNAIIGFSSFLEDSSMEEQSKYILHIIYTSGKQILKMIDDILDLSKMETGFLFLNKRITNLLNVISIIQEMNLFKIKQKNIDFSYQIPEEMPKMFFTDREKLMQILNNLISNAVKYTSQDGAIIVKFNYKDEFLEIEVKDNGIGICKEDLPKLFKTFSRLENNQVVEESGTGLGLAIVSNLVSLFNGKIEVCSEKNKGSSFLVTLKMEVYNENIDS